MWEWATATQREGRIKSAVIGPSMDLTASAVGYIDWFLQYGWRHIV